MASHTLARRLRVAFASTQMHDTACRERHARRTIVGCVRLLIVQLQWVFLAVDASVNERMTALQSLDTEHRARASLQGRAEH